MLSFKIISATARASASASESVAMRRLGVQSLHRTAGRSRCHIAWRSERWMTVATKAFTTTALPASNRDSTSWLLATAVLAGCVALSGIDDTNSKAECCGIAGVVGTNGYDAR